MQPLISRLLLDIQLSVIDALACHDFQGDRLLPARRYSLKSVEAG